VDILSAVFGFSLACLLCLGLTPVVARVAMREGLRDISPDQRATLPKTRAHIGGLAIFAAIVLTLVVTPFAFPQLQERSAVRLFSGVILAGGLVVVLGLIDDLQGSLPWKKLLTQAVAVLILEIHVDNLGLRALVDPALHLPLALLLLLWMLGLSNAMNLIDGLDGLAASVTAISGLGMAVAALALHQPVAALVAAVISGASFAFLRKNAPPASIIMGDTGSMFCGFTLAGVGAAIFWTHPTLRTLLGLLLLSWVPALDTGYAVLRRWANHRSIFQGDLGHLHHRLLDAGFSPRSAGLGLSGLMLLATIAGTAVILGHHALLWTAALLIATFPLVWIVLPRTVMRSDETADGRPNQNAVSHDRAA
jgi:UDP-GlcNAc:undecaprenyl-phosphate GlcNAc-1-phosphate transferase